MSGLLFRWDRLKQGYTFIEREWVRVGMGDAPRPRGWAGPLPARFWPALTRLGKSEGTYGDIRLVRAFLSERDRTEGSP